VQFETFEDAVRRRKVHRKKLKAATRRDNIMSRLVARLGNKNRRPPGLLLSVDLSASISAKTNVVKYCSEV